MTRGLRIFPALVPLLLAAPAWAAEGEDGQSAGLPQFDPHWWPSQIFWLAVTFVLMYAAVSRMILPGIGTTLQTRASQVGGDVQTAEHLKTQAEAMRQAYEAGLDKARAGAAEAVNAIHANMKAEGERRAQAFRDKSEKEMEALEARLKKARTAAMDDMTTLAADLANEAVRKIVGISLDPKKAQTVVQEINRREAA